MSIPAGFVRHTRTSPLTEPWEPIFAKPEIGQIRLGLEIRKAHTNSRGLLHGGMIAALADNAMGASLGVHLAAKGVKPEKGLITTSLSVDFLGRAELGQWLEI